MRYMVHVCSCLEVNFSCEESALNYAKKLFAEGEELPFDESRYWPQSNGYTDPKELVVILPESLEEQRNMEEA
jgi:hypothetical protein